VFRHGSKAVLSATVNPAGCAGVVLSNGRSLMASNATGTAFLDLLAQDMGLTEAALRGAP